MNEPQKKVMTVLIWGTWLIGTFMYAGGFSIEWQILTMLGLIALILLFKEDKP